MARDSTRCAASVDARRIRRSCGTPQLGPYPPASWRLVGKCRRKRLTVLDLRRPHEPPTRASFRLMAWLFKGNPELRIDGVRDQLAQADARRGIRVAPSPNRRAVR